MIDHGEACRAGGADVGQITGALQPGASMVEWNSEGFAFCERPAADPVGSFQHKHAKAESLQTVRRGDPGAASANDDDLRCRRWWGGFQGRLFRSLVGAGSSYAEYWSVNQGCRAFVKLRGRTPVRLIDRPIRESLPSKKGHRSLSCRIAARRQLNN